MICEEKGVLKGSEYFFLTPTEMFESYFYYILVCGHFFCNDTYSIRRNSHLGPLVLLIDDGELYVNYDGQEKIARKNDLVLLNCDYPHAYRSGKHCEFHFFHIGGKNCREITDNLILSNGGFLFQSESNREIRNIMEPLISKMYFVNNVPEQEQSVAVYRILCTLQSSFSSARSGASVNSNMIEDVLIYMRSHPERNFTINELADMASMSPYYFAHLFKEYVGVSPITYMSNLKISLAKNMLLYTNNRINQIGELLGYSSSSCFINAFKARVGVSPAGYRKKPAHAVDPK